MNKHIENVVVGKLLVKESEMFAFNEEDWETVEKEKTLFTEERFLPKILKEAGIVPSTNEVKRNKPHLCRSVESFEFLYVEWGKKKIWIAVGE